MRHTYHLHWNHAKYSALFSHFSSFNVTDACARTSSYLIVNGFSANLFLRQPYFFLLTFQTSCQRDERYLNFLIHDMYSFVHRLFSGLNFHSYFCVNLLLLLLLALEYARLFNHIVSFHFKFYSSSDATSFHSRLTYFLQYHFHGVRLCAASCLCVCAVHLVC